VVVKKIWLDMTSASLLLAGAAVFVPGAAIAGVNESEAVEQPAKLADGQDLLDSAQQVAVEEQLEKAREQLDAAAHEVAELSSQLSEPMIEMFSGNTSQRALLGVQLDTASDKSGARIMEVSPGGPAAQAGLKSGDVIVGINGTDIKGDESTRHVLHLMHEIRPDSKVKLKVLRDGKPRDFVVTVEPDVRIMHVPSPPRAPRMPDFPMSGPFFAPGFVNGPLADVELATLTPQLGRYFGTDKGLLVVRAPKEQQFKLEDGDVILAIDGREPTSGSHASRILSSYRPGEKVSLRLMRQHKELNVESTLPDGPSPGHKGAVVSKEDAPL
jgi:S1-C subfamily serine protease